jgi:predicted NBD/HSP70 family sugar kinase
VSKSHGTNAKLVKVHNRALVLKLIQQHEFISRKEISEITGLTQATITKITNALISQGLVVEKGTDAQAQGWGRKPIGLSINKEKHKIISVFLGRSVMRAAVCDLAGNILAKTEEFKNMYIEQGKAIEDEVIRFIDRVIEGSNVDTSNLLGIAIAAPGPINAKKGILLGAPGSLLKMSEAPFDWRNVNLAEIVRERFRVDVFTDNEANVSALGESWFGKGIGVSNFVLYSVGLGIGSGVIIDGMLYRGEDDVVSEIGHITIDYHGERCVCGNIGCLEMYGSFIKLVESYRLKRGIPSGDVAKEDRMEVIREIEDIFQKVKEGDTYAEAAVREISSILGIGAVSLANIFSPEMIIINGNDVGNADLSLMVPVIQESVREGAFSVIANKVKVLNSSLGKDIHLYGGVALVLQDFFSHPGKGRSEKSGKA